MVVDQPLPDKYCAGGYDEKLRLPAPKNGHCCASIFWAVGKDGICEDAGVGGAITGGYSAMDRIIKLAREIGSAKPAYISSVGGATASC